MIIYPVGVMLFHANREVNGRTDRETGMNLIVAYCNFAKALKEGICLPMRLCRTSKELFLVAGCLVLVKVYLKFW
jgi:hypothetical protein